MEEKTKESEKMKVHKVKEDVSKGLFSRPVLDVPIDSAGISFNYNPSSEEEDDDDIDNDELKEGESFNRFIQSQTGPS